MTGPSNLAAALAAAERGWHVFPLVTDRKYPVEELTDWEHAATADHGRIERWWARHPRHNVAVATGPSRLVVIDLDRPKAGQRPPAPWNETTSGVDVYLILAADEPHLVTHTVRTAGGGLHLYFTAPDGGPEYRNTSGRLGWLIDTRAAGGYVVAAGSTVDGHPYTTVDPRPPVPLPAWIAERLKPPPVPPAGSQRPPSQKRAYVAAAFCDELGRVLAATEGHRNETVNRAAFNLARFVAAGLLPRAVVETSLTTAGEAVGGQTDAQLASAIRGGIDAGLRKHDRTRL